jgi:preprotein translocase subunit SecB
MEEIKKSTAFKFDNFIVVESHIIQNPIKQGKASINIEPVGVLDPDGKTFKLLLDVNVTDENKSFDIKIKTLGVFEFKEKQMGNKLDNYFLVNAPAIIFPYIRSYISALTSLSGIKTINLPLMNLTSLIDKLKKSMSDLNENIE